MTIPAIKVQLPLFNKLPTSGTLIYVQCPHKGCDLLVKVTFNGGPTAEAFHTTNTMPKLLKENEPLPQPTSSTVHRFTVHWS